MKLLLILILFFPIYNANANKLSFEGIPAASNLSLVKKHLAERKQRAIDFYWNQPVKVFSKNATTSFFNPTLSRFLKKEETRVPNNILLSPRTKVYAKYGTNFSVGPFCKRNGDYDFMLLGLINIAYLFKDQPEVLWPETKEKITYRLLSARGNEHYKGFCIDICGCHEDTENHILMTESSRYLTNQLLYDDAIEKEADPDRYDNEKNGFNSWMLNHLSAFIKEGFSEVNSKPYQGYSVKALNNLYDYARHEKVKTASQMVLDFLSARFALQSNQLRRSVTFRRKVTYKDRVNLFEGDTETSRFSILAGNHQSLPNSELRYGIHHAMSAAVSSYLPPDLILDLMIDKSNIEYYQRFHLNHDAIEVMFSAPKYLISAGGVFNNVFDVGTGENDLRARPTVLITTEGGNDISEMIQFYGADQEEFRSNTCVAPNFACGLNAYIPSNIAEECKIHAGDWTFLNLTGGKCNIDQGVYIAMYKQQCDDSNCKSKAENFGFFEVYDASKGEFFDFSHQVLLKNYKPFSASSLNKYTTQAGDEIEFIPNPKHRWLWSIVSINQRTQNRHLKTWPLAFGDIMNSLGEAKLEFYNPRLNQKLTLDYQNPLNPIRTIEK